MAEYIFANYNDNNTVCHRYITNEIQIPDVRDCIEIDHELYMKFTGFPVPLSQWCLYRHNCKLFPF